MLEDMMKTVMVVGDVPLQTLRDNGPQAARPAILVGFANKGLSARCNILQ